MINPLVSLPPTSRLEARLVAFSRQQAFPLLRAFAVACAARACDASMEEPMPLVEEMLAAAHDVDRQPALGAALRREGGPAASGAALTGLRHRLASAAGYLAAFSVVRDDAGEAAREAAKYARMAAVWAAQQDEAEAAEAQLELLDGLVDRQ
jgi:hypothetical protein